jgi:hypothetical protein
MNGSPQVRSTLVVTNIIKLAGVAIALNEAFFADPRDAVVLGFAALAIAGGQGIETFFLALFG